MSSALINPSWPETMDDTNASLIFSDTGLECDPSNYTFCEELGDGGGWVDNAYMPEWLQFLFGFLYAMVSIAALVGNVFTICIILRNHPRRRRFIVDYFIFNLAISDILVAALCVNLTYYSMLYMNWPFGEFMCKLVSFLQISSVSASIFTLVAVSLDRYVHIINPLRPRMTRVEARCVIAVIWVLSVVSATPSAVHSTTTLVDNRTMCQEIWNPQINSYYYTIAIMILLYFFPLLILMITYIIIGIYILKWKMPGEKHVVRDKKQTKAKRKMVKMFAIIVFIFGVCYLPLHAFTLVTEKHPKLYDSRYIKMAYFFVHLSAMSNCVYNPLVYFWLNSRFREGFKSIFRMFACNCGPNSIGGNRKRPFKSQTPAYSSSSNNTQSESLQLSRGSESKLGKIKKKLDESHTNNI